MDGTGARAYGAYCDAQGCHAADGSPLPAWDQLAASHQAGFAAAEKTPPVKSWWKSKTLWVNTAVLALAAAESQLHVVQSVLPGNLFAWLAFALPVVNAALRFITSTAVSK